MQGCRQRNYPQTRQIGMQAAHTTIKKSPSSPTLYPLNSYPMNGHDIAIHAVHPAKIPAPDGLGSSPTIDWQRWIKITIVMRMLKLLPMVDKPAALTAK